MLAVIECGAKQYMVSPGKVIKVERQAGEVGQVIELKNVLLLGNKAGSPFVEGAKVTAVVLEHCKTDKVLVFKKKRRHNYRRKRGHRQQITVLRIQDVSL